MTRYKLNRRSFLLQSLAIPSIAFGRNYSNDSLSIGLTPVILDDQLDFLRNWQHWLENRLNLSTRFVQRLKYRDITDGLLGEQIDAAWVCGYPYVRFRPYMQLLAVPRFKGKPTYHSYVITHKDRSDITQLEQLQDKIFAFSDPDSNSGYLYPSYRLLQLRVSPRTFFKKHFFTWSHRNTIDAVASGLADAGAVDSYIWEQYRLLHPEIVQSTRIIDRSPAFGFPPFVVRNTLPAHLVRQLNETLLDMDKDQQGKQLLQQLGLDGFENGSDSLYSGIDKMWKKVNSSVNAAS